MKNARQFLNHRRTPLALTLLLLLALVVTGCGGDEEAAAPDPTVAPTTAAAAPASVKADPTATAAPAAEPSRSDAPVPAPSSGEVLPPGKVLKSFRAKSESIFSTTYADGTVDEQKSSFVSAFVRTDGPFGFDESFEMATEDSAHAGTDTGADLEKMIIISVGENTAMQMMGERGR